MPTAAGMVIKAAIRPTTNAGLAFPHVVVILRRKSSETKCVIFFSVISFLRFCIHSSTVRRMSGTHNPVSKNAARIPSAASTPNERNAATSLNRLAAKAEIVVKLVRKIARPTRVRVISVASVVLAPFFRSSL